MKKQTLVQEVTLFMFKTLSLIGAILLVAIIIDILKYA